MRKTVLSLLLLTSVLFALKISRDKTDFTFIQLPIKPLPKEVTACKTEVTTKGTPTFEKMQKEYQKKAQAREQKYKNDLLQWDIDKKATRSQYNRELIAYKKNSAGKSEPTLTLPNKPQHSELPAPYFLKEYNTTALTTTVGTLSGYMPTGDKQATLTVQLNGFEYKEPTLEKMKRTKKNSKGGTHTYYTYHYIIRYRHTISVQASYKGNSFGQLTPGNSKRFSHITTSGYSTEYDLKKWWKEQGKAYLQKLDQKLLKQNLKTIRTVSNRNFGFPHMKRKALVRVPSDKRQKYDDFIEAKEYAVAAYNSLHDDKMRMKAKAQFHKANTLWMKALDEAQPDEKSTKKARITREVTGVIYLNLIEAAIFSHDYTRARELFKKMKTLKLKGKQKRNTIKLQGFLAEQQKRYEANL